MGLDLCGSELITPSTRASVLREKWQTKREAGSLAHCAADVDVPSHHACKSSAQRKAQAASRLRVPRPSQALKWYEGALDLIRRQSWAGVGHIEEDRVSAETRGKLDYFAAVLQGVAHQIQDDLSHANRIGKGFKPMVPRCDSQSLGSPEPMTLHLPCSALRQQSADIDPLGSPRQRASVGCGEIAQLVQQRQHHPARAVDVRGRQIWVKTMAPLVRIALYQLSETHHSIERRSKLVGQGGEELGSRPRDQLRVGERTCLLLSHDLGGDVTVSSDECSDVAVAVVLTDSVGLHP